MDSNKDPIEHRLTVPEALVVEIRPAAGGMARETRIHSLAVP